MSEGDLGLTNLYLTAYLINSCLELKMEYFLLFL